MKMAFIYGFLVGIPIVVVLQRLSLTMLILALCVCVGIIVVFMISIRRLYKEMNGQNNPEKISN